MIHQNIYTVPSISLSMPLRELEGIYTFLLRNQTVFPDTTWRKEAFSIRRQMTTTSGELFHTIVSHFGYDLFRPFIVGKTVETIPEYVTYSKTTLDARQVADVLPVMRIALGPFPNLNNRIHIPVTDIVSADGTLRDSVLFQSRVVRDFLSRAFYASTRENWLNMAVLQYICKVYSMTIRRTISNRHNLDPARQLEMVYVFMLYFLGKLTSPDLAEKIMVANRREIGLGESADILQVTGFVAEELGGKPLDNFAMIFPLITKLNPDLKRLTLPALTNYTRTLAPGIFTGISALEYPPLFMALITQALSGEYIGLRRQLQDTNMIKPGLAAFERFTRDVPTLLI